MEFALVAPLFIMLLFGVVEFSLINASIGTFNFAAKDAARLGAIIGKGTPPNPAMTTDAYIVNDVILPRVQGIVVAQGTKIEIYNSTESGAYVSNANGIEEDVWQPSSNGTWTSTTMNWPYQDRQDELANADYLGVKITYTYTYLTAFFAVTSPTITLTADSIQRIEPQQYGQRHVPGGGVWAMAHDEWSTLAALFMSEPQSQALWTRRELARLEGGRA